MSNKFKVIENTFQKETMANLARLLKENDMSQVDLAKELKKDKTTINRWVKNSREIAFDNAIEIAKVLKCHPVDIYQDNRTKVNVIATANWNCNVNPINKADQYKVDIPYEYYDDKCFAIQMDAPGTHSDGEIWLFDIPKVKKFHKNAIGKICYITPKQSAITALKAAKEELIKKLKKEGKPIPNNLECCPKVALLKPNGDGTIRIVHNYTDELAGYFCDNVKPDDIEIAAPVKAKFDPDLIHKK